MAMLHVGGGDFSTSFQKFAVTVCVFTGYVTATKCLRIQTNPDTCRWGQRNNCLFCDKSTKLTGSLPVNMTINIRYGSISKVKNKI